MRTVVSARRDHIKPVFHLVGLSRTTRDRILAQLARVQLIKPNAAPCRAVPNLAVFWCEILYYTCVLRFSLERCDCQYYLIKPRRTRSRTSAASKFFGHGKARRIKQP